MIVRNKKGQVGLTQILMGLIILFILVIGVVALFDWNKKGRMGFLDSLENSISSVSEGIMSVLGPLFTFILNLQGDTNTKFLMVLAFILISIIVVGTLDSVNIFGEDRQGGLINLAMGIIVSIIGVRFMPPDLWASLTAPSSAFVATILVGVPFAALFFVTMKLKFNLARKLLWLFYLILMSYLIFFPEESTTTTNEFMWVYIIFLILAGVMMFFDASVRRIFYSEIYKKDIEDLIGNLSAQQRYDLRRKIEKWQKIENDDTASKQDKSIAKRELSKLIKKYGDLSAI